MVASYQWRLITTDTTTLTKAISQYHGNIRTVMSGGGTECIHTLECLDRHTDITLQSLASISKGRNNEIITTDEV